MLAPTINCTLKYKVVIILYFVFSYHYTVLQICKKLLCMNPIAEAKMKPNVHHNNHLRQVWVTHWKVRWPLCFIVAMLLLLHSITHGLQCNKFLWNASSSRKKDNKTSGKPHCAITNWYLALSTKNHWNTKKDNMMLAMYSVAAAVAKKARRTKQR